MRTSGVDSWSIGLGPASQLLNWPLWIRAAERIHVPAGGSVPGPLDTHRLPEPSLESGAPLVEGWLGWWRAVLDLPRFTGTGRPDLSRHIPLGPPFDGLAAWPALHEVVQRRWPEAEEWHRARRPAGVLPNPINYTEFVGEIERSIGRRAAPFELDFILLPVRDDKVRPIDGIRFLVPERLHGTPAWFDWLRPVVTRLAMG